MKQYVKYVQKHAIWLFLLLLTDGMAALTLWLADVRAFFVLSGVLF